MLHPALDLDLKCFTCSITVLDSGSDLVAPNDLRGTVVYFCIQILQHRLNRLKVGTDLFDSAWGIFDVIDGLNEELGALKSCRGDSQRRSGNANAESVRHPRESTSNATI